MFIVTGTCYTSWFRLKIIKNTKPVQVIKKKKKTSSGGSKHLTIETSKHLVYSLNKLITTPTLVEHPDDDEAVLVAGGQFLVLLVPGYDLHCTWTQHIK